MNVPDEMKDGVTHINVYSKGKTFLGQQLSNFANTPFIYNGKTFASVEAWWYFRNCGEYKLLPLYGFKAKKLGQQLVTPNSPDPTEEELLRVYKRKLADNKYLRALFLQNRLPYDHYYVYNEKVVIPRHRWTGELWNKIDISDLVFTSACGGGLI